MADSSNSISAPSANPTFDPNDWLARFEAAGGGWLVNSTYEIAFTAPKGAPAKAILAEIERRPEKREAVRQYVLAPSPIATRANRPINWPEGGVSAAADLCLEIEALDNWTRRLEATAHFEDSWHYDDPWKRWAKVHAAIVAKVEALPNTPENNKTKARMVWSIIGGDMDDLNDGEMATHRLVRQIITSLALQAENSVELLCGVGQIAEFVGLSKREAQHLINIGRLPIMRQAGAPVATRGALMDWKALRAAGT